MVDVREKMNCYDDRYDSLLDWYGKQLRIKSPTLDGTNAQLQIIDQGEMLMKAALTTGDAAAVNALYQLGVFVQYSIKPNAYGCHPKTPWKVQGYRAVKAASKSSAVGVAEGGALGTGVEPTYYEVAVDPKEFELVGDYSTRLQVLSEIADAVKVDQNRQTIEKDFFKSMDADLLKDFDTLAGNNIESIDRLTASAAEQAGCGATAGDDDIYGIDRGAEGWADANSEHASGTDRILSEALIDALRRDQEPYWETFPENKVFITGFDTWTRWGQLEAAKQRYGTEMFTITIGDGVKTAEGAKGGFKLATWDGVPIIRDDSVEKDTISRIYLEDLEVTGIAFGRPIGYSESDNMFEVGHLVKGVWYGIGELYATAFKPNGKLRDLK